MIIADKTVDLRRGIDYIGVGACAVVHDGHGNILLMKRGEKARDERGRWDICGGAIEFGETVEDAIRRELMEEICANALEIEFITAYDAHRTQNDIETHWVQMIHAVRVDPATVAIGEPHKIAEIGWFDSATLPEPLHSQFEKSFKPAQKLGYIA